MKNKHFDRHKFRWKLHQFYKLLHAVKMETINYKVVNIMKIGIQESTPSYAIIQHKQQCSSKYQSKGLFNYNSVDIKLQISKTCVLSNVQKNIITYSEILISNPNVTPSIFIIRPASRYHKVGTKSICIDFHFCSTHVLLNIQE